MQVCTAVSLNCAASLLYYNTEPVRRPWSSRYSLLVYAPCDFYKFDSNTVDYELFDFRTTSLNRIYTTAFMLNLMFCRSVCLSRPSVTLCIVAKRCVLEQKLLLAAYKSRSLYKKSINTKMNDIDFCLEVV